MITNSGPLFLFDLKKRQLFTLLFKYFKEFKEFTILKTFA